MSKNILKLIGAVGAVSSAAFCVALYGAEPVSAITAPTLNLSVGTPVNSGQAITGMDHASASEVYVPISVSVQNAKDYAVYFHVKDGTMTGNKGGSLTSLDNATTATLFSDSMMNHWGYRVATGSSAAEAKNKALNASFAAVPTSERNIHRGNVNRGETAAAYIGLDFGMATDGSLTAGDYDNTVYVSATATPLDVSMLDITYFQEMTPSICTATLPGVETALTDSRDGKVYKVAKLADNECWMVQNLALDSGETEATRRTITGADSDLASVSDTYKLPVSSESWSTESSENMYNGTHADDAYDTNNGGNNSGAWYNWNVATAGYDLAGNENTGEANISICPKGWRLPTGGNEGQFTALWNSYSAIEGKTQKQVLNMDWHPNPGGYWDDNGTHVAHGWDAVWWSRSIQSDVNVYGFWENNGSGIGLASTVPRIRGYNIRCVAASPKNISEAVYMQDMNDNVCSSMDTYDSAQDNTYSLKDIRDNKSYKVAKLADGNCWMVQNLALDSGATEEGRRVINGVDSDLASASDTYKLPMSTAMGGFTDDAGQYMYNGSHKDSTYDTGATGGNAGAYYSWRTAIANSEIVSSEAKYSICPKGWRLPSRDQYVTITSDSSFGTAWHWTGHTGAFGETGLNSTFRSMWWTRIGNVGRASNLNRYSDYNANDANPTKLGISVRCVH